MVSLFHRQHSARGTILVEGLVAIFIAVVVMVGLISTYNLFVRLVRINTETTKAVSLLEEGFDALRLIRDNKWYGLASVPVSTTYSLSWSGTSWATTTSPEVIDGFTRSFVLEDVLRDSNDDIASSGTLDPGTKLVTLTVSWDSQGTVRTRTLTGYITNIFESN